MKEALKEIDLTDNQANIYLALLELGPILASKIAEKTKINRSLTYTVLQELIEKGVVSYFIQNNKKFFKAAEPSKLLEILKEKEEKIKNIIPKLKQIKKPLEKERVEVYKGKEGLKTVLDDILKNCGKEYFVIGGIGKSLEVLPYFIEGWHKRRIKAKITRNMILSEEVRKKKITKFPLTKIKYLPQEYRTLETTMIYDDKIAHIIWVDEPLAIVIESKKINRAHMKEFKLLWKMAKK